jgi:hypothetical protein
MTLFSTLSRCSYIVFGKEDHDLPNNIFEGTYVGGKYRVKQRPCKEAKWRELKISGYGFFNHFSSRSWEGPSGIPENSREFPDPFSTQFFPIPVPVLIGLRVPAKF